MIDDHRRMTDRDRARGAASLWRRLRPSPLLPHLPLHLRLLIGMAVPLSCIVLGGLVLMILVENNSLRAANENTMNSVVVALTNEFHRLSLMDDQEVGLEIADRLRAFEEINRCWLFDPRSEHVFSYAKPGLLPEPPPRTVDGSGAFIRIPLVARGQHLGYAVVEPSLDQLRANTARLVLYASIVAAVMLGVGLGIARLLGRGIAAPITQMSRFVVETAESLDTSRRVEVEDHQEVGALARAINRLLEVITDQRTQLESTNARIEQEVEQRTRELRASERRIRVLATYAPVGIFETDPDGRCIFVNRAWTEITGIPHEEAGGLSWLEVIHPDDREQIEQEWRRAVEQRADYSVECRIDAGDGGPVWVCSGAVELRDEGGTATGFLGTLTDITERKRLEDELRYGAFHDRLTGLPNRVLIRNRIDEAVARASSEEAFSFALLYIDFDHFKVINDTLGHHAGDEFLKTATARLCQCCEAIRRAHGAECTPARLGGDEFVVLTEGAFEREDMIAAAEDTCGRLASPYEIESHQVTSSASIGLVFGSARHVTTDDVLRDADIAMYHRKLEGRNGLTVFNPDMHSALLARSHMQKELEQAVEDGQFVLHYQPIVSLTTRRPLGFEALVRWEHPTRGLLYPADFLEVAEDSGLIVPIDRWVLHEACRQIRRWQTWMPDPEPLFVSVNVARRHVEQSSFLNDVREALGSSGVRPSSLMVELTESTIMHDVEAATEMLTQLRALGVRIAMDDFGTGHSSLACLRGLPLDTLKIDRSFVSELSADRRTMAILHAIITLAGNLDVTVVSEGIEHADEVAPLISLDCPMGQGFYFGRPMPAEQIPAWCVRASAPSTIAQHVQSVHS